MPVKVPVIQTGLEKSIQQAAQKAGKNLKINMGPGAKSIESLSRPLGNLTGKTDEFTKSMSAANARVLAFGASVGIIAAVSKSLKELVTTTISVEKNLANINSILRQSDAELNKFKNNIFDIARNTGQTFDTVAEAALELSRQGLKAEEVTKRLNDALVLSRLSGLSAADSVAGLTAAINSFSSAGITSAEVLNKISAAAASAAVSDRDLIEGLKRSGAVAVASGIKFDDLIGIISALQEKTARGGAVIGNSLKTIFTRIQDLDRLNTLQDLGVQVTDFEGKVLSSKQVIENLGPVFAKLDQSSKVNLADNLVGKFQIAPFLALMEDYNGGISRSAEVANVSLNASSEAYKRNEALSQTLAASINTATVSLRELANALGEIGVTENLSNIIGVFNSVVSSIQGVLDGDGIGSKFAKGLVKGIGSVLAGPGLALALVAIGKLLLDFAKFGGGALKTFFGLNTAAQKQAALQGQIAASLLNDKGIRSAILSIEKQNISEGEKKRLQTAFFTKALNEQLAVMQRMQGIARTIAPGVMAGTSSGRGGRKGRAAGGFLPVGAERSDISRGVGGAPASAKPVVIPNFAFGGGKRGTMVANDSEYIVPNYANGGDAIFNQNMASSMGLPANARKVRAASGYIPNFAVGAAGALNAANITSMTEFNRLPIPKGGKKGITSKVVGGVTISQAQAKNAFDRKKKGIGKRSYMANKDPKSIMLVPRRERFLLNGSDHHFAKAPYRSAIKSNGLIDFFEGPSAGISKRLKKDSVEGGRFKTLVTLDGDIENALAKGVNGIFTKFRKKAGPDAFKIKPGKITSSNIKDQMEKGGPGALGAIKGATFEALMRAIVGGVSQNAEEGQLDIDFSKDKDNILDKIFGIQNKNFKFGDFKSSRSGGNKTKFAKQILDNVAGRVEVGRKAKTANSKTAASGYIPNFAEGALEDAIGREQAAGLPVSQIRINQSGKLRNSQNPQGLAVTNTRDEPTGAIPAARGFIPNFFGGVPSMGGLMDQKFKTAANSAEKSAKALDKNTNNLNKNSKSSDGLTGKFFAIQGVMSIFGSAVGESGGALGEFAKAAITSAQIMLSMQAFGMTPGLSRGSKSAGVRSARKVAVSTKKFSQGRAGAASQLFSKLGPVARMFGKMGPIIGRVVGGLGRFVPILGTVLTLLPLINMGLKKLFNFDLFKETGKFLGLIKSPASEAAEALGELAKQTVGNLKPGNNPFEKAVEDATTKVVAIRAETRGIKVDSEQSRLDLNMESVVRDTLPLARLRTPKTKESNEAFDAFNKLMLTARINLLDQDQISDLNKNPTRENVLEKEKASLKMFSDGDYDAMRAAAIKYAAATSEENDIKSVEQQEDALRTVNEIYSKIYTTRSKDNKAAEVGKTIDTKKLSIAKIQLTNKLELAKSTYKLMTEEEKALERGKALQALSKREITNLEEKIKLKELEDSFSDKMLSSLQEQSAKIKGLNVDNDKFKNLQNQIDSVIKKGNVSFKDRKTLGETINKMLLTGTKLEESGLDALLKSLGVEGDKLEKLKAQTKEKFEQRRLTEETIQLIKDDESRDELRAAKSNTVSREGFRSNIAESEGKIRSLQRQLEFATPDQKAGLQRGLNNQKLEIKQSEFGLQQIDLLQKGRGLGSGFTKQISGVGLEDLRAAENLESVFKVLDDIERDDVYRFDTEEQKNKFRKVVNDFKEEVEKAGSTFKDAQDAIKETRIGFAAEIKSLRTRASTLEGSGLDRRAYGLRQRAEILKKIEQGGEYAGLTEDEATAKFDMSKSPVTLFKESIPTALEASSQLNKSLADGSTQFAYNIGNAMTDAIAKGGNLGDILMGVATDFLNTMSKAFMKNAVDNILGNFISNPNQAGGAISGGSGTKDDVPAMLMGGEFVMNKKAVKKYGMGFMSSLNNGAIQGFANGGIAMPGFQGAGAITGASDLMSFATQSNDPGMGNMTMFGRRNSKLQKRYQAAKGQAFDLSVSETRAREEAERIAKERRKGLRDALKNAVIGAVVSAGASKMATGFGEAYKNSGGSITKGLGGMFTGGSRALKDGGMAQVGGLFNMSGKHGFGQGDYVPRATIVSETGASKAGGNMFSGAFNSIGGGISDSYNSIRGGITSLFSSSDAMEGAVRGSVLPNHKMNYATGGAVPQAAGVDTVPAMLSGGEFVMNSAATQRIGSGNLATANAGGSTTAGDSTELVAKMEELITVTQESGRAGDINITINGSDGKESKEESGESNKAQRELSEKIKTVVKQVITDEQRLGGQLRK